MKIGLAKINKKLTMDAAAWSHKGGENCPAAVIRYLTDQGHSVVVLTPADISAEWIDACHGLLEARHVGDFRRPLSDWDDLDGMIVFGGAMANDLNATRSFRRFIAPTVNLINETMRPWLFVLTDPRYWPRWLEMENRPRAILTQVEDEFVCRLNYESARMRYTYAEAEKWQFYGMRPDPSLIDRWSQRPMDVVVCSHEHGRKEKLPLKDPAWQLMDRFAGQYEVYGEWQTRSGPSYKGIVSRTEVQRLLTRGRSTFLVPIWNGWTTPKFYEACLSATVPLINSVEPQVYDAGCHTGLALDHPWRVKEGQTLDELTASLTRDDAAAAQALITEDMTSGAVIERQLVERLRHPPEEDPLIEYVTGQIPIQLSILTTIEQTGDCESIDLRRCVVSTSGSEEPFVRLVDRVGWSAAHELVRRIALREVDGEVRVRRHVDLPEYVKRKDGPETCV